MNEQRQRRSSPWPWVLVIFLGLFLLVSLTLNAGFFVGMVSRWAEPAGHEQPVDEEPAFEETWSYGHGETKVARIALEGIILREAEGGWLAEPYDAVERVKRQIRAATHDEEVAAIILEVDSPGGGITASDELYRALEHFRNSRDDRRVVVYMRDVCASGGYYVAAAGDWLIAEPTSIVGSIGVILQALNWKGLSDKVGLTATVIKSGENKDLLNPFEEVSQEDITILQTIIDEMYQRFVNIVADARDLDQEALATLADGRVFSGLTARDNGLVDEVGGWEDAVARTAELLGEDKVRVVRYESMVTFWNWLATARAPRPLALLRKVEQPRFLYLWNP